MTLTDLIITYHHDKPSGGMWHCGPNPCWVTIQHTPTMQSVTVYDSSQYRCRKRAMALIEMMIDDCDSDKCGFPEVMK